MKEMFEKVFNLISLSFPKEEYRTYKGQKNLLDNPNYFITHKLDENNNLLGVICFWRFKYFTFIEHFAVDSLMRGKGVGSKMLKEFINKESTLPIILEVELPENEISLKRIKFYEKNGFKLNTYKYFQMPLRKNFSPVKMHLMSYPVNLTAEKFEHIKNILEENIYNGL